MTPTEIGEFLETKGASDEEIDEFLEHFGVKGQQWGVRRAEKQAARSDNKAKNVASRQKDKEAFRSSIDAARASTKGGFLGRKSERSLDVKKAKQDFDKNKAELGSREARKVIQAARLKKSQDIQKSKQIRDGKEAAVAVLLGVGLITLHAVLSPKG